jgi:hypothetical protein
MISEHKDRFSLKGNSRKGERLQKSLKQKAKSRKQMHWAANGSICSAG